MSSEDVDAFCQLVAETLHRTSVMAGDRLVADLKVDELSMAAVIGAIEDVNPYFRIPEQLEIEDLTVGDLHHFCFTMTNQHWV